MILLLALADAFAHGGEDHGTSTPTPVAAGGLRLPLSTTRADAVLAFGGDQPGSLPVSLWAADADTSAPIALSAAKLALSGPESVALDLSPSTEGLAMGTLTLEHPGSYAGSLVLQAGERAELLAVTGLSLEAPAQDHSGFAPSWAMVAGSGLLLLLLGLALGRRCGRSLGAALLLVGAGLLARPALVEAHGGEDHGPPVAQAAAPGGALTLPMASQFLVGLRTARVDPAPFQEQTPAFGALVAAPDGAARLVAPVAGQLQSPPGGMPRPGSAVTAGQLLASLVETPAGTDRADLAAGRADRAARHQEARAALALAERDAAQIAPLGGALSEREILERQGRLGAAREAVTQAESALRAYDAARITPIRAPLSGRLTEVVARPGDAVAAGDPLMVVVGEAALWMVGRLPEREALGLSSGADATVVTAAGALPAQLLDAGGVSDPRTGMVSVTLALDTHDLRPGLSATAWLTRGPERQALVVPESAVLRSEGAPLVFVKTGPETFEARPVRTGARAGETTEILAGLVAGERAVTSGTSALRALAGR